MVAEEPENYLAILKASYDYSPQSDDEIAIKEDQLLLLVEKVDDEWWKVKIKASSQETDSPVGLVPAAYVEQAEHTSVVRALYDYDATAPGELSLHEDDMLLVFDTEDDWLLVQNSKVEGKAGYVPGNYVEVVDEEQEHEQPPAPARIVVPDSPPRPVSVYVDPADRVASTKVTADDIQTWAVSEIDKKGKKKKGTLGIGNGAVFFASEADKTPVQKWQTKDVSAVSSEKSKHVRIDIGGSTPISLHFHAGSKENADNILAKLQASKALSTPDEQQSPQTLPPPDTSDRVAKKASVHFSSSSPVIIPTSKEEEEEEEEEEAEEDVEEQPYHAPQSHVTPKETEPAAEMALALYDFAADGEDELSVMEGERLTVLEKDGDEWWKCRNSKGKEGVVPASYLEAVANGATPAPKAVKVDHEAEERKAQELLKQQEAERLREEREEEEERKMAAAAARKAEAQQKAKQAALAAEAERQKRKEAAAARLSPPPAAQPPARTQEPVRTSTANSGGSTNSRASSDSSRPPPEKTRVWHDRSGQFRVEAAFLGFNNGKLRLHKVNGVIVEVPSEKMSLEDMRYVERLLDKRSRAPGAPRVSEDDIPLAISKGSSGNSNPQKVTPPPKKAPRIDWFDFFLSAGCDLDDCTRYAASFERDKIDETLLADITESTMRSLGLREGDIIRVSKAIEKRKPTDNLAKPSAHLQEQLRRDEELARQLQLQENAPRGTAPNLFAGPGGVLKPRRGRPQPSKSLPLSTVDLKAISSASDQIQRIGSPQMTQSTPGRQTPSLPTRPESAAAVVSGFEDDAWTNRPSSTKPVKSMSPAPAPRAPSAPPPQTQQPAPTPTVAPAPPPPAPTSAPTAPSGLPSLAKTTESDIFEQLAKLSQLRQTSTPSQPQRQQVPSPAVNMAPPASYSSGFGMGPSPIPMGQHLMTQPALSPPPPQPYNGPRGPFAPVPGNQSLLQPLIPVPTQPTGFNTFIPTQPPVNAPSPFQSQLSPPSFLSTQPTGFLGSQPLMSQPTGFTNSQPLMSQPTGFPNSQPMMAQPTGAFGTFNSMQSPFQGTNGGFGGPIQSLPDVTGFNPPLNPSMFGPGPASPPPLPSNPSNPSNNTSPANVFAQMKSGTFANDDTPSHGSNSGLNGQAPGWGQSYQGYTGY
ncbi:hypothetical protein BDZ97DRAFT_2053254 [Flammula alnicola]|nr:hypothetical protein BDZ97DRAFT_2053254 [Flammula alnicola]